MQRSERQTPRGTTNTRRRVTTWTTGVRQAVAQAIPPNCCYKEIHPKWILQNRARAAPAPPAAHEGG
eukprot:953741-Pleurochrysis_carterae.AAC.2